VEANESKQPQNEKNYEDGPEHCGSFSLRSTLASNRNTCDKLRVR
jgi:hypothetical protein